jgi:hypothetical protein
MEQVMQILLEIVWESNFHSNYNFHTIYGYSMDIIWI